MATAKKSAARKAAPGKTTASSGAAGKIRVGIGGWTFEPWRGVFYPEGLPHAKELSYAASRLTSIEVNGTFYRTQTPATYASWASQAPDGFQFSLKAPRAATNRRVLPEAGPSIERFLESGPLELGDKLGPILWQLAPTKRFDAGEIGDFIALLPASYGGRKLRHAIEVRHNSFLVPEFVDLARKAGAAIVFSEHETFPQIADVTADFVYLRLQKGRDDIETAYRAPDLDHWTQRLRAWAEGGAPDDIDVLEEGKRPKPAPRDVYAYIIHEGKVRAPAGAQALIERLGGLP